MLRRVVAARLKLQFIVRDCKNTKMVNKIKRGFIDMAMNQSPS